MKKKVGSNKKDISIYWGSEMSKNKSEKQCGIVKEIQSGAQKPIQGKGG